MTAETLKTFIALPSSGSTYSKSKRNRNLITVCLSTVFSLICLTLLGVLIFNSMRINELQRDLDSLKKALDGMHKRLGLDYFDDLNDFEDHYSNTLNEAHGDLLDSFEDEEDDDLDTVEDGSGVYDDESYDDLEDDLNLDDYNPYEETLKMLPKRSQRSIATHTGQSRLQESIFENKNDLKVIKQSMEEDYQHLTIDDEDKLDETDNIPIRRKHSKSKDRRRPYDRYYSRHHGRGRSGLVKRRSSNNRLVKTGAEGLLCHSNFAALHFILNGTTTSLGHPSHSGNARLRHDGDVYVGYADPWSKDNGLEKPFAIERGCVRITESGIYLIYAQVYYHNHMDRNGFFVYRNSHVFLQCALTVPENRPKGNTCYTSGVTYLEKDDVIHLRDIYRERAVTFNERSFFGIVKLSEVK